MLTPPPFVCSHLDQDHVLTDLNQDNLFSSGVGWSLDTNTHHQLILYRCLSKSLGVVQDNKG
jgi:hypothetical protein